MASSDITTEPRLRARGPIRDTLPAAVAYGLEGPNTWPAAIACPACCSGFDISLRDELRDAA
jgi:hypothetical protein